MTIGCAFLFSVLSLVESFGNGTNHILLKYIPVYTVRSSCAPNSPSARSYSWGAADEFQCFYYYFTCYSNWLCYFLHCVSYYRNNVAEISSSLVKVPVPTMLCVLLSPYVQCMQGIVGTGELVTNTLFQQSEQAV